MTLGYLKNNNLGLALRDYFIRGLQSVGIILFTAISRKVVEKRARDDPEREIWDMINTQ